MTAQEIVDRLLTAPVTPERILKAKRNARYSGVSWAAVEALIQPSKDRLAASVDTHFPAPNP